jgi:hypothetical protein
LVSMSARAGTSHRRLRLNRDVLEQKQNYRNVAPSVQGGFFLRKNPLDLRGLTLYQFCFC